MQIKLYNNNTILENTYMKVNFHQNIWKSLECFGSITPFLLINHDNIYTHMTDNQS